MTTKTQGIIKDFPIKNLIADPDQPRQEFDEVELKNLENSIKEKGILNPITLEPTDNKQKFLIVDGERRYRVAKNLKLKNVPVNILSKKMSKSEKNILRFQLQETHSQWSIFEKAEAMAELKNTLNVSIQELASSLGVSATTCENYLAILSFPTQFRKLAVKIKMPHSYLRGMATVQSALPDEVREKAGDCLNAIVEKYKKGYIRTHKDFSTIHKLIRAGEYEPVIKFFTQTDYTASNALMSSGYVADRQVESVISRAQNLIRDIQIIQKNNLKIDEIGTAVLTKLSEEIAKTL